MKTLFTRQVKAKLTVHSPRIIIGVFDLVFTLREARHEFDMEHDTKRSSFKWDPPYVKTFHKARAS